MRPGDALQSSTATRAGFPWPKAIPRSESSPLVVEPYSGESASRIRTKDDSVSSQLRKLGADQVIERLMFIRGFLVLPGTVGE